MIRRKGIDEGKRCTGRKDVNKEVNNTKIRHKKHNNNNNNRRGENGGREKEAMMGGKGIVERKRYSLHKVKINKEVNNTRTEHRNERTNSLRITGVEE